MQKLLKIGLAATVLTVFSLSFCFAGGTVTAWGTLKIEGHALGYNVTGAKIELQGAPNPYKNKVRNKFEFYNVPTEVPCQLTIEIQSPTTGGTISYNSTYTFHKASLLAGKRGKKASGYLGDFVYILEKSQIRRDNKY